MMKENQALLEGLVSGEELDRANKKRTAKYVYKKIVKQDLQPYYEDGWEKTGHKSKKHVNLRKPKAVGPTFEDLVWTIFYKMGFGEMNATPDFAIPRYESDVTKQIDVFARDEQCICLLECKAAEKPHTKRSMDKDIDQFAAIHHELELSIFSHYKDLGNYEKFKVLWLLALKNIEISENDRERAQKAGVQIIDESMVDYYYELSSHFGRSSKYQFLADMFPGMDIPDLIDPLPAIKGKMGKTVFYSFVVEPIQLLKIAYIAHRARTNEESMKTYQRMASRKRLGKIAKYIHEKEGLFPTSIVLNIETKKPLKFEPAAEMAGKNAILGKLYLPNKYKTAWIIDGQHSLYA